ncbi:MAG: T9SS type A sorting domain-containing protein [Mariniphaga sp.]|nr:T9SS type A sorting domain-containing protein [Mariniphaga sp.]
MNMDWKYFLAIFLLILLGLSSYSQKPSLNYIDKIAESKANLYLRKAHFSENISNTDYDLIYQRMEWEINPAVKYIKGAITSHFISNKTELESIQFDLHHALTIDSVKYKNQFLAYLHQNNVLTVSLETHLNSSELDSLTVFYQGIPESTVSGSFVQSQHNNVPIIWTLSEPYGAMEWWPCKQSLSDKIDSIDIIVTSPEMYRTASNGILISEKTNNGMRTMAWKHRYPIATYLVAIAVTNYADYSDYVDLPDGKQIEILNYVYPENLENAKQKTPQTIEIMELYNQLFGIYPFADEKYGHAQFGWGGGMEHQTMSFMVSFGFDLTAHELAHQWFGDYVTLASWHDIWLNEGFATWATGLAYENLLNGEWWPNWRQQLVQRITAESGGSVYVQDTTNVSRIFSGRLSYSKGAYLLHMLRWILSDEVLFKAINNYLQDPEIANGFATQEKLVYHLELESDTNLTEFFNDWYYGEGYPIYTLQYSQNSDMLLKINLFQETSHESVDFFEMPVQIRCYSKEKTDSIDFRLEHNLNGQEFIFDPGFKVEEIKVDPEIWLISKTGQILSIPWVYNSDEIMIYPNPAKNYLNIFAPNKQEIKEINIFDSSGGKIQSFRENQNRISIENLSNGLYMIKVVTSSGELIQKIVKQ